MDSNPFLAHIHFPSPNPLHRIVVKIKRRRGAVHAALVKRATYMVEDEE